MVLEDKDGKFCVEEVFTSNDVYELVAPFKNDKMKMIGYLSKLKINSGYLIY